LTKGVRARKKVRAASNGSVGGENWKGGKKVRGGGAGGGK